MLCEYNRLQGLLPGVEVPALSVWASPVSAQSIFSSGSVTGFHRLDSLSKAARSFSL